MQNTAYTSSNKLLCVQDIDTNITFIENQLSFHEQMILHFRMEWN